MSLHCDTSCVLLIGALDQVERVPFKSYYVFFFLILKEGWIFFFYSLSAAIEVSI
jgi:hypothetical protein